jgi:glutamyl-tRNA reductase
VNLLVVGVSHRTAGVPLLERLAVPVSAVPELLAELVGQPYVGEALVLSTCNRVEVYAAVSAFHGGLADIGSVLARHAQCPVNDLASHLYVHYDAEGVRHAFRVAGGLDSMVVGEAQILGQLRDAYRLATEHSTAGRLLHELMQHALRVGKRVHAETGIDRAGQSVVSAALQHGLNNTGRAASGCAGLVIGAGAMGSLSLATLRRAGADPLQVANRSQDRAARLAAGYSATVTPMASLPTAMSTVDIVVCATASMGHVLTVDLVTEAVRLRDPRRGPLLILDLAVPRDVEPDVAALPGVVLVDLTRLGAALSGVTGTEARAAEELVNAEVDMFLTWLRGSDVAPTVAALRARADEVVEAELSRLAQRRSDLTDEQRADVARAVHRVVQRLLHLPTVRVRQLAAEPGGAAYAAVLRELFDLDVPGQIDVPGAVEAAPTESFGPAPAPADSFGPAPAPADSFGPAPAPARGDES